MYNLKQMSDETLLNETQKLVDREREILSLVLHHLREIERRRLYGKYGSLFEYATKELKYSEDQAYRRIQAMRLVKELPQIEEKIEDGTLTLTHLGMAQSLFKREERSGQKTFSKQDKIDLLQKLETTSKREAEKMVSQSTTVVVPFEKIRAISSEDVEIKFTAKETLIKKIQKLKGILAHKNPNLQLSELIDQLCDLGLEKWDKSLPAPAQGQKAPPSRRPQSKTQVKKDVWTRDKGKCQLCGSEYAIELDHRIPKSLGGGDTAENLRLLCRSCNQREAIEALGMGQMNKYLNDDDDHRNFAMKSNEKQINSW